VNAILTRLRPAWVAQPSRPTGFPACRRENMVTGLIVPCQPCCPEPERCRDDRTNRSGKMPSTGSRSQAFLPRDSGSPEGIDCRYPGLHPSPIENAPELLDCRGSKRLLTLKGVPGYHPAPFQQGLGMTCGAGVAWSS